MEMRESKITREFFQGKRVLVFGFGTNGGGVGTLEFLLTTEVAQIIVTDQKSQVDLQEAIKRIPVDTRIEWRLGGHSKEDFERVDVVIKNPGIRFDNEYLVHAKECGAEIFVDSAIFFSLCEAPIIGVTGSKGKTTTTSLLAHILEAAGKQVVRVGVSQVGVLSRLQEVTEECIVVFELSSWRLAGLRDIEMSPHIAIITNLYPDHLNYYEDMQSYAEDKAEIFLWQQPNDVTILSAENEWTEWFGSEAPGRVLSFGRSSQEDAWQDELTLWIKDGEVEVPLIEKKDCALQGEHNFANILAATLGAIEAGVSFSDIRRGVETFRGVPHRFERVRELDEVTYINDTTATIPDAVKASVESLSQEVVLLAGGSDKDLPLAPLIEVIETRVKHAVLFKGSATDKIVEELDKVNYSRYTIVHSMKEAVDVARSQSQAGDVVLLSPGAASFGMFRNEFDRGEQFQKSVNEL